MNIPELRASIEKEIRRVTDNGRCVVFAYAAAPGDASAIRIGVTSRRSYGDVLLWLEHSYPGNIVHSGSRQDPSLLEKLAADLISVKIEKASPVGFNADEDGHWPCFGEALSRLMPRRWGHRGFALFDISGFSEEPTEIQVSRRLMLDGALLWARTVVQNKFNSLPDKPALKFSRVSTGDGYYLWSTQPGPVYDAATFLMMLLTAGYIRVRERSDREWEVRSGFTVGKAVTLPYFGNWAVAGADDVPEDAIGPALNSLARILGHGKPSQILIGDFLIKESSYAKSFSSPSSLLDFIKAKLPNVLGTLDFNPKDRFRVIDKHGDVYHCFNIAGTIETRNEWHQDLKQQIGVDPDDAKGLDDAVFFRGG